MEIWEYDPKNKCWDVASKKAFHLPEGCGLLLAIRCLCEEEEKAGTLRFLVFSTQESEFLDGVGEYFCVGHNPNSDTPGKEAKLAAYNPTSPAEYLIDALMSIMWNDQACPTLTYLTQEGQTLPLLAIALLQGLEFDEVALPPLPAQQVS